MKYHPLIAVSLKMYMNGAETRAWISSIAEEVQARAERDAIEVAVFPSYLMLGETAQRLRGTGIHTGAQNVFWEDGGAYTGEVSAPMLAEIGCRWVEVGHAERRRLFGEDDLTTSLKARAALRAGLTPLICVGELEARSVSDAIKECVGQVLEVIGALPSDPPGEIAFAYEPVWAIGAVEPATPDHIRAVLAGIRSELPHGFENSRLIYGGAARPGLFSSIVTEADGIFLGRFAHDPSAFGAVLDEVIAVSSTPPNHRMAQAMESRYLS